jgi:2-polyprenyl-3-methyl-5-hydroxy-6-metoxy-1,4-benzoquinol methylase
MTPETRIVQSWSSNAAVWADAIQADALESRRLATNAAIVDAVLRTHGQRVLDVGCGEGWLARELARAGRAVVGFDGSDTLVERARQNTDAAILLLDYAAFAADPAAVGGPFDSAVCNFSILARDILPLLDAIRRCVRSGGTLVIQTVHPLAAGGRYEDGWREETFAGLAGEWAPMPWYFRTFASWVAELHAAQWRLTDCREPVHPGTGAPASLILCATPAE